MIEHIFARYDVNLSAQEDPKNLARTGRDTPAGKQEHLDALDEPDLRKMGRINPLYARYYFHPDTGQRILVSVAAQAALQHTPQGLRRDFSILYKAEDAAERLTSSSKR